MMLFQEDKASRRYGYSGILDQRFMRRYRQARPAVAAAPRPAPIHSNGLLPGTGPAGAGLAAAVTTSTLGVVGLDSTTDAWTGAAVDTVGIGSATVVVNSGKVVVGPGSTVVDVDVPDDSTAVAETVVDGDVAGVPVLAASTSPVSEVATTWLRFEPGHDVALIAR